MLALFILAAGADPSGFTVVNKMPPAFVVVNRMPAMVSKADPLPRVVPTGMHAHRRTDGTILVHGDENYGSAAAHAGIVWPWPKVATAGQTVPGQLVSVPYTLPGSSSCPGGVCPAPQSAPAPLFQPFGGRFRK